MNKYLFTNEVYVMNWRENWSNNFDVRERASKEREKKVQILQDEFYRHLDKFIDLLERQHFLDYMHDVENNV